MGYPGGYDRSGGAEAASGGVFARVSVDATPARRAGVGGGDLPSLRGRRVHPAGRRSGQGHGYRGDEPLGGVTPGRRARRPGGRVPRPPFGWRPLPLLVDRRSHPARPRGRPGGQRGHGDRHRGQRWGRREIIGFDIVTAEDTASCTEFLRGLVARGLWGWSWSSPTPTAGSKRPSRRCWPRRPGSAAAPTSWPTWPPGCPRPTGP